VREKLIKELKIYVYINAIIFNTIKLIKYYKNGEIYPQRTYAFFADTFLLFKISYFGVLNFCFV
jgi:hypothetical protein